MRTFASTRGPPFGLFAFLLLILPNHHRHPATGPFTTNTKATSHRQGHVDGDPEAWRVWVSAGFASSCSDG